jgi:quercetin dioxygenase-like cupin family protein
MSDAVVCRKQGEGTALWMLGGLYEVKLSGEESDGSATVIEMTLPPGQGPPPHVHPGAESVYVLEGSIDYHIGDDVVEGTAGSFFHIPAGTLERFEPTGDVPVRLLVTYAPGGIDRFFAEAGEQAPALTLPPPSDEPPDLERISAIGTRYGMDIRAPG